jgi:hypothetical protein
MSFQYMTGDEIRKGDYIKFHGEPGRVEFVAEASIDDPETNWYVEKFGGGAMITVPTVFGNVFLDQTDTDGDLILVARAGEASGEPMEQTGSKIEN